MILVLRDIYPTILAHYTNYSGEVFDLVSNLHGISSSALYSVQKKKKKDSSNIIFNI